MMVSVSTRVSPSCHCARSASWQVPSDGSCTGVGGNLPVRGSRSPHPRVIAHNGLGLMPPRHGCEAAVAIFRDTGSRQAHTRVISHALPPGRCHRMAHGRRPAKSRHLSERFLHSFQSVEMTEGWQSVEMTGEGSVFCHVALSPSNPSGQAPTGAGPPAHRSRDISQPLSAAEDCRGPAGLAKTKRAVSGCQRNDRVEDSDRTMVCHSITWSLLPVRHVDADGDISQLLSTAEDCRGPAGLAVTEKTEVSQFRHCA
jgi:hypothetical protein